jgi:hypothetical protein
VGAKAPSCTCVPLFKARNPKSNTFFSQVPRSALLFFVLGFLFLLLFVSCVCFFNQKGFGFGHEQWICFQNSAVAFLNPPCETPANAIKRAANRHMDGQI